MNEEQERPSPVEILTALAMQQGIINPRTGQLTPRWQRALAALDGEPQETMTASEVRQRTKERAAATRVRNEEERAEREGANRGRRRTQPSGESDAETQGDESAEGGDKLPSVPDQPGG